MSILTNWRPSASGLTVVTDSAPSVAFPNGRTIAQTNRVSVPDENDRRRIVSLIVAAPKLRAALLAMVNAYCYADHHLAAGKTEDEIAQMKAEAAYAAGIALGEAEEKRSEQPGGRTP